jgi:hypothetical protein
MLYINPVMIALSVTLTRSAACVRLPGLTDVSLLIVNNSVPNGLLTLAPHRGLSDNPDCPGLAFRLFVTSGLWSFQPH